MVTLGSVVSLKPHNRGRLRAILTVVVVVVVTNHNDAHGQRRRRKKNFDSDLDVDVESRARGSQALTTTTTTHRAKKWFSRGFWRDAAVLHLGLFIFIVLLLPAGQGFRRALRACNIFFLFFFLRWLADANADYEPGLCCAALGVGGICDWQGFETGGRIARCYLLYDSPTDIETGLQVTRQNRERCIGDIVVGM